MVVQSSVGKSKVNQIWSNKREQMLLESKCYSTCDSDLLVSLGILPDSINCFGRKTSLSTKCIAQLVIESELLGQAVCRCRRCLVWFVTFSFVRILSGSVTIIHARPPCVMIAGFIADIHSIMFSATPLMIVSAPMVSLLFTEIMSSFLTNCQTATVQGSC